MRAPRKQSHRTDVSRVGLWSIGVRLGNRTREEQRSRRAETLALTKLANLVHNNINSSPTLYHCTHHFDDNAMAIFVLQESRHELFDDNVTHILCIANLNVPLQSVKVDASDTTAWRVRSKRM